MSAEPVRTVRRPRTARAGGSDPVSTEKPNTGRHWLVKQEPAEYPWARLVADGKVAWTGVRNFQARNHLRSMALGDLVLYYHTGDCREVVGVARVVRAAYPDPTAPEGDWVAVDLAPAKAVARPVSLAELKADPAFRELALLRQTRLSVVPLRPAEFARVLELGRTRM